LPAWTLQISKSVVKDLRALPKDLRGSAAVSILELTTEPRPHGTEKLSGYPSTYRFRIGDYRIVYEIGDKTLTVIAVRHRRDVYRDLK
jgi:mRNA interferase RelE/StbE